MNNFFFKKGQAALNANQLAIYNELRETAVEIRSAKSLFESVSNEDLVEACVFRLEGLYAKHRYLLKQAKELGLQVDPFSGITGETA
ncbi:MAG: DUF2508 family protein [Oscillospiraceae bacterium]|jgi:hypothetical protein|nr:DUF2508 family protein [Oscillospiraceae bacterium]